MMMHGLANFKTLELYYLLAGLCLISALLFLEVDN